MTLRTTAFWLPCPKYTHKHTKNVRKLHNQQKNMSSFQGHLESLSDFAKLQISEFVKSLNFQSQNWPHDAAYDRL